VPSGRTAQPERAEASSVAATVRRYRSQPPAERFYVGLKLRSDPVVSRLAALGSLGRVLDAGAGRGQFGLYLCDRDQLDELRGFDPDPRKLRVARAAARGDAQYELADLEHFTLDPGSVDTVLLIDVLHYLSPADQDAALARIKTWLAPGGSVIVREVGTRSAFGSFVTRSLERAATLVGYNRARRSLGFRPLGELVKGLEELGFRCQVADASAGTPFDNALIVARLT
jgi:SAM-dependent methyltransferase